MKKIKTDNVLIIIAVLLILVYIFYECYSVTHIELETETAVMSTVYDKIEATALVVREEQVIEKPSGGVTVPSVSDGDKVNVGGRIAMTFPSAEAAENYSKYSQLQSRLKYYENLESQTLGQAASVESINSEIDGKVDAYIRAIASGKPSAIESAGESVNDGILRRQMIIGESIDLVSIIQDLRKQSEEAASSAKPESNIQTEQSGVFSGYTDGYETLVDYEKAEEMSAEEIEKALASVSQPKEKDAHLGKLITSYAWYFECVVDADKVKGLSDGDKIQVALKDSDDTVLTVQIVSGAQPDIGAQKTALILKSSNMDSKLASLRKEDIEIRIKAYEGIKMPASALHVSDGKKGVYALISSQVKFREAEVIYSQDDFVMLQFDPDNANGIRLYDKVIIKGKELEDGRVYT